MAKKRVYFQPTMDNIEKITSLPYITRAEPGKNFGRCGAWTNGFPHRCPSPALYKYQAGSTKRAHAKTGTWCWSHLFREGLNYRVYDWERAERAWKKLNKE